MSGLEIGAAVFGLVVGTIDIIHKSIEIYDAVKDKSGIPKKLRTVSDKLSSVEKLLKGAQAQYNEGKLNKIDRQTWDNAKQEIGQCKELCQELHNLLLSAYPEAGSGSVGRVWKGTQTVFSNKGKSAEALLKEIWEHLDTLAKQQIINNTALLEDIKSLVEELCPQNKTTSMKNVHGDNFIGDKNQYYNQGSGPMINSPSGPINFGDIYAAPGSTQIYQDTTNDKDHMYQILLSLRWPNPDVIKNRLMENKDKLLSAAIEWIFQDTERFLNWQNNLDMSLLWIKGGPGKGKTMMTIGITERILSASDKSVLVTFFFCQNADSQLNTIAAILKGLILRLLSQNRGLEDVLLNRWNRKTKQFTEDMNVWQTLWDVFLEMLDRCRPRKVYVVIDALDECEDKDMADFLGRVVRRGLYQSRAKWLLTSRPLDSAEPKLLTGRDQIGLSLELNSEHVARGVQAYIAAKVLELDRGKHYGDTLRARLNAELKLKAEGTFLWVSLVCKALEDIPAKDALATVNDTPEGLVPLYQRAFQQLHGSREFEACEHILKVLMLAYRPLHVSELGGLTNTNGEQVVRRLVDQCSSFIRSRKNSVEFVHQSARDYLGGNDGQSPLDSPTPYEHLELAISCLSHLNRRLKVNLLDLPRPDSTWTLSDMSADDSKAQQLLQSLDYAATFWIQHLQGARLSRAHQGVFANDRFLSKFLHGKFLEWLECLALLGRFRVSVEGIKVLKTISARIEQDNDVLDFAQEAMRFVLRHYSTMAEWPLQIYSSAILFTPQTSMIRRGNLGKVPSWLKELPEVEEAWSPLIQTLGGHSSSVTTVAFSHDGTQLASASEDDTIKLWDHSTGELRKTLKGHSSWVVAVAFSHDGTELASASDDYTIKLWDPSTGELRKTWKGHSSRVTAVAFSHDGKQLALASEDDTIKLWDPSTGELRKTLKGHSSGVVAVAFSHDGTQLASASWDNTIKLWDPSTGELRKTLKGHSFGVVAVAFSHDGTQLASASWDKTMKLWDPSTGELRRTLKDHFSRVTAVAFSHDGTQLASASDDYTIKLWDPSTGELRKTLKGHSSRVTAVAFSHDGTQLASASEDCTIKLWDLSTVELRKTLKGHSSRVIAVAFSHDGTQLASASEDDTIKLWDPSTGELRKTLKGHSSWVTAVAFSHDGTQLASASEDDTIKLWDPSTGELRKTLKGHYLVITAVAFSHDGTQLASASEDDTIKLWDPSTGELRRTLKGHFSRVTAVAFSHDGTQLASASEDDTIKLWDPSTGELRKTLKGHSSRVTAVAFSHDGTQLASASGDNTIKLWDTSPSTLSRAFSRLGVGYTVRPVKTIPLTSHITSLSYSSNAFYLNTDRGIVELVSTARNRRDDTKRTELLLSAQDQWIYGDKSRVVRLPYEYVLQCFDSYEDIVVVGCGNGALLRFKIDRSRLCSEKRPGKG